MSRQAMSAQRHILQALSRWPKDPVRPELQFQDVLRKRFEQAPTASTPSQSPSPSPSPAEEQELLRQANALYSLLDNRYQKKYPITGSIMRPKSNPTYYEDLLKELEEGPRRSWFQRVMLRIGGLVRLQ